ncbi:MAG: DUF1801 domain-containing protein [Calditrichaeota bacterium]|nr:DUF1801 domain-containing protein [Calditrichota bacterium]MCB0270936.1 DUF1801 domain-containing protein [Calditrichota bacterium]MCB9068781.1 DUF1801 domain-containing protein [Calditrichia bacterium]
MGNTITEIDKYLAELPDDRRVALQTLRELIHTNLPDVLEMWAYNMPSFERNGIILSFASQKNYMSLYVCETDLLEKYAEQLAHLNCGKSCIRFKKLTDLPMETVSRIIVEAAESTAANR